MITEESCATITHSRINKRQNGRRFKHPDEEMFTLTGQDIHGVSFLKNAVEDSKILFSNIRICKLTPLECWRLQGFPDEMFFKARNVNSDTQLYKQAGNSVTVNVVYAIAKRLKELETENLI